MKKAVITLVFAIFVFATFAQVYDDFIYTRKADSTIPYKNANPVEKPQSGLLKYQGDLAGKLSTLLMQEKIKEVITILSQSKITINDPDDFWKQVESFRPYFKISIALDSLAEMSAPDKTMIYYGYAYPEGNGQHLTYRVYFIFHHQGEETKSLDIMFVKLPKNNGSSGVLK